MNTDTKIFLGGAIPYNMQDPHLHQGSGIQSEPTLEAQVLTPGLTGKSPKFFKIILANKTKQIKQHIKRY